MILKHNGHPNTSQKIFPNLYGPTPIPKKQYEGP